MKHLKKIFEIEDNEEDDRSIEIFEVDEDVDQTGNSFQITDDESDELNKLDLIGYEHNLETGGGFYYYKENDNDEIEGWIEEYRDPANVEARKFRL